MTAFRIRPVLIRSPFRWDPQQEFEALWQALEQVSNRASRPSGPATAVVAFIPEVDLYDAGSSFVIKIDLPGVLEENLDISIEENTLTVSGRCDPDGPKDEACLSRERPVGRFARRITLPKHVDIQQATATLRKGVLEITVAKTTKATVGKVTVQAGD